MQKRIRTLVCLALAGSATQAAAQERSSASCWLRPAPAPACSGYFVTEAAIEFPFATTSHSISPATTEKDFDSRFVLSIGFMKSMPGGRAAGIVVGHDLARSIDRAPTRVEGRLRQWRGMSAIDLSAGVSRKGIQSAGDVMGFTTAVGGEWRYLGADARLDLYNAGGRTVAGGYIGARATSAAAPVAALLVFGAIGVLIATSGAGY